MIVMRYGYLRICDEYRQMEELMSLLEHERQLWTLIKKTITANYLLDKDGIVFAYRKL